MSDNKPKKHHYLPVFYLKRWAGPDGKLVEFSRPHGPQVKPRRVAPAGAGFEKELYTFHGLKPEKAQLLESGFFHYVDTRAADAIQLLENHASIGEWTSPLRQAWVTFLFSLMVRMPADIAVLKQSFREGWHMTSPEIEEGYQARRGPDDPPTAAEYFSHMDPIHVANLSLQLLPGLVQTDGPGTFLMNMHWFVLDAKPRELGLLTSDRPLVRTNLLSEDAYWQLPIGPTKMFFAVKERKWEQYLRAHLAPDWLSQSNRTTVRRAVRYAYGRGDTALRFVNGHLAAEPLPSIFHKSASNPA